MFYYPGSHLMPILPQNTLYHIHSFLPREKVRAGSFFFPCLHRFPPISKTSFLLQHLLPQGLWVLMLPAEPGAAAGCCLVALERDATRLRSQRGPSQAPSQPGTATAAAHLLATARDLFLVHRHRETDRSYTGILSAVCSYGNKPI